MADCPCCSRREFDECCGPLLAGERPAAGPEELLRSRYTAFVKADIEYIRRTIHPSFREEFDEDSARSWAEDSQWLGLEVLSTSGGGEGETVGKVDFVARYRNEEGEVEHHELAEFRKVDGRWYFYDGKVVGHDPFVREQPKVGRNEACPCGSGKKYKKCCGR